MQIRKNISENINVNTNRKYIQWKIQKRNIQADQIQFETYKSEFVNQTNTNRKNTITKYKSGKLHR